MIFRDIDEYLDLIFSPLAIMLLLLPLPDLALTTGLFQYSTIVSFARVAWVRLRLLFIVARSLAVSQMTTRPRSCVAFPIVYFQMKWSAAARWWRRASLQLCRPRKKKTCLINSNEKLLAKKQKQI